MICQSWKVMFQAEYSSGQPLRMLVDLRASVDAALNSGTEEGSEKSLERTAAAKATLSAAAKPKASAAAAGANGGSKTKTAPAAPLKTQSEPAPNTDAPEFEISASAPEWNPEEDQQPGKKKQ
jgi:hypothetical protein